MNGPQNLSRPTGARRAWAQPRFLLGSAALTLVGATLVTFAAPSPTATKTPVAMPHTTSEKKAASLADLPAMMARYGEARRLALASTSTSTSGRTTRAVGTGTSGFNLVETDLTPNSPSDEREPVVSPNGDFIAFTSTGADTDNDGLIDSAPTPTHRHIWVMNRDGSGQRQLTGFGADAARDQTHPTWSPDGNQIAYADQDFSDENSVTVNQVTTPGSQLYIVDSLSSSPTPAQITFFKTENNVPGQVQSPAWAPSGLSIAFVTNYDARTATADGSRILPTRDIFTIAPDGNPTSITRLTGDAGDPNGDDSDDDHPAWGIANSNVLFFSSNRDASGLLTGANAGGRRIWRIFSDGTSPNPITNPLQRPNGQPNDADDYPAPSTIGGTFTGAGGVDKTVTEMLAFQTNTYIDNSDQTDGAAGRDLNVWSLPISSRNYSGTESRIYVSSYDDGKVTGVNVKTLQPSTVVPRLPQSGSGNLNSPEGIAITQNASGTNYVYVSDRGRNQVARFVESTGAAAGNGNGTTAFGFTPATVPNPTALALYNGYIYVASGFNPGAANTSAIYRFTQFGGNPAGNDATGLFSSGETATNGGLITNGSEGLAINSTGRFIAVSEVSDNKVNLYDASSGAYLFNAADNTSLVPANGGNLNTPTGLIWGPDVNGDSYEDLYVCSSGNDSIKVYAGPNPVGAVFANVGSASNTRPGTLIATLVADAGNGTGNGSTGLNGPESIDIQDLAKHGATASDTQGGDGTYEIYVTSFRTLGVAGNGTPGGGYQVNRYELSIDTTTPGNSEALPWPAGSGTPLARPSASDPMVNAAWISLPSDPQNPTASGTLAGAGGFAFNFTALNQGATTTTADETVNNVAVVQTNILSSPKNFADSRLTAPQTVDRAADGQPAYSRTAATAQTLARLVFVSGRKYTPSTASNGSTTPVNPNGGDGTYLLDSNTPVPNITHDIWAASTKDTTPPALVPQGAGNLQYPVVAPQPNAPYFAPRTAEAGLKPNITPVTADSATEAARLAYTQKGGLRFAVVLRDVESGLNETTADAPTTLANASVTISLYNADARNFQTYRNDVDENVHVQIAQETKASRVSINAQSSFPLNVYDDGPVSGGGHEQQAGAVPGDGVYYCEALVPTPGAAGDFYIDLSVKDRQNNAFTYDNIWGISTKRFTRTATNYNLFVSDYTCGQNFPLQLTSDFDDPRYANMPPVESYYLTNPGGTVYKSNDPASADFNVVLAVSTPETFSNVDVWRTLCRGPVSQDVLNAYRPTITKQIDPNTPNPTAIPTATPTATATPLPGSTATPIPAATATPTAGPSPTPTGTPEPFTQLTRPVAVASTAVIWGAPYAGTTFVGPGTITDSTTQAALTSYLQDGGRLFISGRDIARALTLTTGGTNSFLTNELAATFNSNEASSLTIAPGAAPFVTGTYSTLEFPYRPTQSSTDANHFNDAAQPAINPNPGTIYGPGNYMYDIISASGAAGTEVAVAYNQGGTVGQRVENTRANGIRSRLVYFSFGFESVNRRYRQPTTNDSTIALNIRRNIALNILEYFRTSSVSGTVSTASSTGGGNTNVVVPNFLLRIDGPGGPYLVRTDANGNYFVSGLTSGTYTVRPYTITKNGVATTLPEGYFGGTPVTFGVGGGGTTRNVNLTVVKAIPGGIIGKAVASNGTFSNRGDDTPIPNLPVLVRSVGKSSAFPNSGKFAKLGTTNATGDFSISGVPALAEMEVIFNPNVDDIPAGSGISYSGPNTSYGRRIVPDSKRPNNAIIVPSGDNFILNDTGTVTISGTTYTVDTNSKPDTAADERVPVLVPVGPTISGVVSVNNTPVSGATVQLFPQGSATPVPNPIQTSGTGGKTGTNGAYSFVDVTPGNYTVTASILRDGITFVRSTNFTLVQGTDQTQNINFTIATLTGKVVQGNNVPAANATVTLQNTNGTNFVPARTAKTNAQGIYTLVNVPVGGYTYVANSSNNTGTATFASASGNANYKVFASLGTLTGSSANFAVNATATTVTVPTIQLTNQQLAGVVKLQVDANQPILNLAGATVELLDGNGNSFSPQRTTTSASDGSYGFTITAAGTYRVKATYHGDVVISNAFTASPGPSTGPTLLIRLRTVYGTTFDSTKTGSDGKPLPVGGVSLSLLDGTTVLATTTSSANGSFTFAPVKAGSGYVINAVKSSLAGTAQVPTLTRTASPAVGVPVYMVAKSSFTPNPTSFVKGRTYSISMPYETSTNATTRNIYDLTRGDATVALTDVFNYDPVGVNASGQTVRFYTVSRFNPNTLAYEAIPDNGVLRRGEGYLLNVTDTPANGATLELQMPSDNPALKALTEGNAATTQQFYISLAYNDSLAGNTLNGRNLIGFGFNPAQFSRVVWDTTNAITDPNLASVQVLYGSTRYTLKQAVDAGIIYPTLTTIDGTTGRTISVNSINAYGGYFVTARKAGIRLLLKFPQSN